MFTGNVEYFRILDFTAYGYPALKLYVLSPGQWWNLVWKASSSSSQRHVWLNLIKDAFQIKFKADKTKHGQSLIFTPKPLMKKHIEILQP